MATVLWSSSTTIFLDSESQISFWLANCSLNSTGAIVNTITVFNFLYTPDYKTNFTVVGLIIQDSHKLLITNSQINFFLDYGYLPLTNSLISGNNCNIYFSNIFFYKVCTYWQAGTNIQVNSENTTLTLQNTTAFQTSYGLVLFTSANSYLYVNNLTLLLSLECPFVSTVTDLGKKVYFYLDSVFVNGSLGTSTFLRAFSSGYYSVKNCFLTNLYSEAGIGGFLLILGKNNEIYVENVTIVLSVAGAGGSLCNSMADINNTLVLNNSFFYEFISVYIANIGIIDGKLIIENSYFHNFSSKIATFISATNSQVKITNIHFDVGVTDNAGFLTLIYCNASFQKSDFTNLSGFNGVFMVLKYSTINLLECEFYESTSTDNFFDVSFSNFTFSFSKIHALSGGNVFFCDFFTIFVMIQSTIHDIALENTNIFKLITNNSLMISDSNVENIENGTSGAVLQMYEKNLIFLENFTVINVNSTESAILFIFIDCILTLKNSYFEKVLSETQGGVIYGSLASIQIINCDFRNSKTKDGGFFYLNQTTIIIINCNFSDGLASNGNSGFTILKSNVSLISSNFTNIYHELNSEYSVISVNNGGIFTNVNIEGCLFNNNGIKTQYGFYVSGVISLTISMNIFETNSCNQIIFVYNSNIALNDNNFTSNNNDILFYFINDAENENILQITNIRFKENQISSALMKLQGNNKINLLNVWLYSNRKNMKGSFIFVQNSSDFFVQNLNSTENSLYQGQEYFFEIKNTINATLNQINLISNNMQFLKSNNSGLNIISLNSYNESIYSYIDISNADLIINNTDFIGLSPFSSVCQAKSCTTSTISVYTSSLWLSNVNFENLQNLFDFPQIEIAIYDSKFVEMSNVRCINDIVYSIYASNVESLKLLNSDFEIKNQSLKETWDAYGRIEIINQNLKNYSLMIDSSNFLNLGSENIESPLYYESAQNTYVSNIQISNSYFRNNSGQKGGALFLKGITNTIIKNSSFISNQAKGNAEGGFGGSIYSHCTLDDSCFFSLLNSEISNNSAFMLGGGIFLRNYKISELESINFSENSATLVNDKNNSNMTSPFYINLTYMQVLGEDMVNFTTLNQNDTLIINNKQPIVLRFEIYDSENRKCSYINGDSQTATISLTDSLSFISMKESRVIIVNGTIDYTRFEFDGSLNNSYNFQLEVRGTFSLIRNINFYVRPCNSGEYYDKNIKTCVKCPYKTYSLYEPPIISTYPSPFQQEGLSVCQNCPDNSNCAGQKIAPMQNYWINESNYTTKIVQCPLDGTCIYENFSYFSKPVKCAQGYEGPLCVICGKNYAKDSFLDNCSKCEWDVKQSLIFCAKLIFMLFFVTYQVNSVLFTKYQKETKVSGIIIKIVRDHMNQIFLIYSFCNIFKVDGSYFSAYQSVNSIVTGTSLNFDCYYDGTMNIIYFKVISVIVSPFIMQIFVSIIFLGFFLIKKFVLKKQVFLKYFLKTNLIGFIVICDTQYTQILIAFLKLFECVEIDSTNPHSYLRFSPTVQCYSDSHLFYSLLIGLPCLIVWVVGLPLIYFILLYLLNKKLIESGQESGISLNNKTKSLALTVLERKKTIIENSPTKKEEKLPGAFEVDLGAPLMLSFLFYDYSEKKYYWTSVIMLWKAALSILVTFITGYDIYIALFVFYFLLLIVYSYGQPYKNESTKFLALISFYCNMTSIILGEYIENESKYTSAVVLINLLVHLIFLCLALLYFVKEYEYLEMANKIIDVLKKKEKNKFVRKIIEKLTVYTKVEVNDKKITINPLSVKEKTLENQQTIFTTKKDAEANNETEINIEKKYQLKNQIYDEIESANIDLPDNDEHKSPEIH